jgi:DNA-directed RNA polymerase subunit RPC12/RpoP
MNFAGLAMRCMRCGAEMEMRDPAAGRPWTPDQFWVCVNCGRHFWTTYPPPKTEAPKPAAAAAPAAAATPAVVTEPAS